jgi:hypothetical protein
MSVIGEHKADEFGCTRETHVTGGAIWEKEKAGQGTKGQGRIYLSETASGGILNFVLLLEVMYAMHLRMHPLCFMC